MSRGDQYVKLVDWSEDDSCFIGSCPELSYGGATVRMRGVCFQNSASSSRMR